MKTVIMQPYLFPYLGYWQMIAYADAFVLFDDVNFINRGWINRNNILLNGKSYMFTLPLVSASQNKLINQIDVTHDEKDVQKILKTIEQAYRKAPYFSDVFPLIVEILNYEQRNLKFFLMNQFQRIFDYLGLNNTKLLLSSDIEKNNSLKAQDKIIDICKKLGTKQYINAIGGVELYDKNRFAQEGMELYFIKMILTPYSQFKGEFVPYLSIIDVLMFNDKMKVREMLKDFELV